MSQDTTARPTRHVRVEVDRTVTPDGVTAQTTRVTTRRTIRQLIADAAAKVRGMFLRGWNAIKRGGRSVVAAARSAARTGATWLWSAGVYTDRAARALGRGTKRVLRDTTLFLTTSAAYVLGWTVRAVSWTFRTVLESAFSVALVCFLIAGVLMWTLAWAHDSYESKIHTHARAASVGEYRPTKYSGFGSPIHATSTAASAHYLTDFTPGESVSVTLDGDIEVPTDVVNDADAVWDARETELWYSITGDEHGEKGMDFYERWFHQEPDILPVDITDEMEEAFFANMSVIISDAAFGDWRAEHGKELTDNEFFTGHSYWTGRNMSRSWIYNSLNKVQAEDHETWPLLEKRFRADCNARRALFLKDNQAHFDSRQFHKNSFRKAFDHQVEWTLMREKHRWLRARGVQIVAMGVEEQPKAPVTV